MDNPTKAAIIESLQQSNNSENINSDDPLLEPENLVSNNKNLDEK